tara:strand:+ start:267 stop:611 length:345 start_codon:yes stop_codon:yes gene_type:complete
MNMIKIYHNPRCRKSREALKLVQDKGNVEIIEYMTQDIDMESLKIAIASTGLKPSELVRKNEAVFKESYKGKELSEDEWLEAFIKEPKLLERPIVIKDSKGVLGRPPENVLSLF